MRTTCDVPTRDESNVAIYLGYCTRSRLLPHRDHWDRNIYCDPPRDWAALCAVVAVVTVLWSALLILTPPRADAAWEQPYGGCKEAWQAPRSEGARECREHGWFVARRLVVNPRGVVRAMWLPECNTPEAATSTCYMRQYGDYATWEPADGSALHWVWAVNPIKDKPRWHWATMEDRNRLGINRFCVVRNYDDRTRCLPGKPW